MKATALALILALAACGADGDPEPVGGASAPEEPGIGVVGSV